MPASGKALSPGSCRGQGRLGQGSWGLHPRGSTHRARLGSLKTGPGWAIFPCSVEGWPLLPRF